jgi:hypothetical protein
VLFYVLFLSIVLFYVLSVCKCVLYYCHRVSTQLQLNISYHITLTDWTVDLTVSISTILSKLLLLKLLHWAKMKNASILAIWRTNCMVQHSSSEASQHCFIHILIITGQYSWSHKYRKSIEVQQTFVSNEVSTYKVTFLFFRDFYYQSFKFHTILNKKS